MEYWEFLLQKEGDQSWLPLESSQVEILEGRYRIMAHTSRTKARVEVQIGQLLLDPGPPKRRKLNRQGQINEDGLMVVMPFTRLGPGLWDIQCAEVAPTEEKSDLDEPDGNPAERADLSPQSEGEATSLPWSYAVQLRVQAQDMGEDGDWFADEGRLQAGLGEEPHSTGESSLAATGGSLRAAPAWPSLDLDQVAAAMNRVQTRLATATENPVFAYHVALTQTALVGSQGQSLELGGQVTGVVEGESCADMALVVRLADPQTTEAVALCPFALGASALPADFTLALAVPTDLSTRLLLGDIALVSIPAGTVSVLALQRFTVTVDLASLFDAIANRAETESRSDLVFPADSQEEVAETETEATTETWANVDLPQAPTRVMPTLTLPRSGLALPPKLYYPSPNETASHRPVLPPLGPSGPKPSPQPAPGSAAAPVNLPPDLSAETAAGIAHQPLSPESDIEAPGQTPDQTPDDSLGQSLDEILTQATMPVTGPRSRPSGLSLPPLAPESKPEPQPEPDPGLDLFSTSILGSQAPAAPKAGSPKGKVPLLPSHEVMAFRELRLQDRFWNRLNDLAVELQQEALAQRARQEAQRQTPYIDDDDEDAEIVEAFVPFAGEVVIYEDEDETLGADLEQKSGATLSQGASPTAEIITPPVPIIEMPEGELIAGDPVLLSLRVPFHPNRLYLKVWIADPQTRSLADEPRQIMHLSPNGRGELEGSIQLTVPMGCLEAWFEAISIDLMTQQESYKTSVCRTIVPVGVDSLGLDEFEL